MAVDTRQAHQDLMNAEALSRRDEAVAQIHRSRGIESEYTARASQAEKQAAEIERLGTLSTAKDPEGTRLDVADSAGNVAKDAAQANEGGIGVNASNSGPDQQDQRTNSLAPGETVPDEVSKIEIPDNWGAMPWPQRAALARSVSRGTPVSNGDDAEKVIEAELERRKA